MKLKTFRQMRIETDVYQGTTTTIPEDVRAAINEWFDSRYVCDNDNFVRFFRRILNRDYLRYMQLLRIEPGIAQYDWLVSQYMEAQKYSKSEGTTTHTGEKTTSDSREETKTGSDTVTKSDSNTRTDARTESRSTSGESTRTPDLQSTSTETRSDTNSSETESEANSNTSGSSESESVGKANPQSISYEQAQVGKIPSLDWRYPGTQGQDKSESTSENESTSTSTTSGEASGETSGSTTQTGTETTESSGAESITHGGTLSDIFSGSTQGTTSETGTASGTTESEESATDSHEGENLDQSINSGRGESPAELLRKATAYIKASSAIMWLLDRLEPCFIGIYDV